MDTDVLKKHRFWQRAQRVLRVAIAINLAVAVWAIGFRGESAPPPVLPDTELATDAELAAIDAGAIDETGAAAVGEFSLDLDVLATVEHDLIYAVEQRARPAYRIFSLDPATGAVETVFTVPDDAIIYGIALSPDRQTLAVGYTPDYALEGSGISLLDLATGALDEAVAVTAGVHYVDLSWSGDGERILATEVDRRGGEELAAVTLDITTGATLARIDDAINPVEVAGDLHYLRVDEDKARRSIGVATAGGDARTVEIGEAQLDLDHLTVDPVTEIVRVAVLDVDDAETAGVTFGSAADAHGSHDVPANWFELSALSDGDAEPSGFEPIIVYDAVATPGALVYATKEGLSIATDARVDVVRSRAIRFVAG